MKSSLKMLFIIVLCYGEVSFSIETSAVMSSVSASSALATSISTGSAPASKDAINGGATKEESKDDIDLSLINDVNYNLSKPIYEVKPNLGAGLRYFQSQAGGKACSSCAK